MLVQLVPPGIFLIAVCEQPGLTTPDFGDVRPVPQHTDRTTLEVSWARRREP